MSLASSWKHFGILFVLVATSALYGCASQGSSLPKGPKPYEPSKNQLDKHRPVIQADIDRSIKIRNKFIEFYNNSKFDAAYSELKPLSAPDYPIDNISDWQKVFLNQGDVLLMQIVAAYGRDKALFKLASEETGYSEKRCVKLLRRAAENENSWADLTTWAKCHARSHKDPASCEKQVEKLEKNIVGISLVIGKSSGYCRD